MDCDSRFQDWQEKTNQTNFFQVSKWIFIICSVEQKKLQSTMSTWIWFFFFFWFHCRTEQFKEQWGKFVVQYTLALILRYIFLPPKFTSTDINTNNILILSKISFTVVFIKHLLFTYSSDRAGNNCCTWSRIYYGLLWINIDFRMANVLVWWEEFQTHNNMIHQRETKSFLRTHIIWI